MSRKFFVTTFAGVESVFDDPLQLDSTLGIFGASEIVESCLLEPQPSNVCPSCGWSEKQWEETLMVGCPLCYEVFSDQIDLVVRPKDLVSYESA